MVMGNSCVAYYIECFSKKKSALHYTAKRRHRNSLFLGACVRRSHAAAFSWRVKGLLGKTNAFFTYGAIPPPRALKIFEQPQSGRYVNYGRRAEHFDCTCPFAVLAKTAASRDALRLDRPSSTPEVTL